MLDQLTRQLPRHATVADNDPGPDDRHRHARRSQPPLDVAPAAQMCGERVVVASEPPQVDDTPQPGQLRGLSEHGGTQCVFALEIGVAKGVNEVIRQIAAGQGSGQAVTVKDVPLDGRTRSSVCARRAGHGNDLMSRRRQSWAKPTADEAGRPGDKYSHDVAFRAAGRSRMSTSARNPSFPRLTPGGAAR